MGVGYIIIHFRSVWHINHLHTTLFVKRTITCWNTQYNRQFACVHGIGIFLLINVRWVCSEYQFEMWHSTSQITQMQDRVFVIWMHILFDRKGSSEEKWTQNLDTCRPSCLYICIYIYIYKSQISKCVCLFVHYLIYSKSQIRASNKKAV